MAKAKSKKHGELEYQVNIAFDPRDHIYVARVPELENCHSHGSAPEEALRHGKSMNEFAVELLRKALKSVG